ncbi:MAG: hypothetical protein ABI947_17085 [Chloroflexota bacterium]
MFKWLESEISQIKTRRFHMTDIASAPHSLANLWEESTLLPPSYRAFLTKFGQAKLYRYGNSYSLVVFSPPIQVLDESGERLVKFGYSSFGTAYFKYSLLKPNAESPVFEKDIDDDDPKLEKAAKNFEQWLNKRRDSIHEEYSPEEWQQILNGPPPFTSNEVRRVEARQRYKWDLLGFKENGDIRILVKNESEISLPYLGIGVKSKDGSVNGRIWLPVLDIKPGEENIIEHGCYNNLIRRSDVVLFDLPDPEPEDRALYWEFK